MNVTSFWQSLELLQAKLDRDTADFYYDDYKNLHYLGDTAFCDHPGKITDVPAWSLGKLWSVVGKVAKFDFGEMDSLETIIESLIELYKDAVH